MDPLGNYRILDFPRRRLPIVDTLDTARTVNHVAALLELDITRARAALAAHKAAGRDLSFTAWLVAVLGQVVGEHKHLNRWRQGRSKVVEFDDVDVSLVVERRVGNDVQPLPFVLRRANEKSVAEITAEIRAAQREPLDGGKLVMGDNRIPDWLIQGWLRVPGALRRLFLQYLRHDARRAKAMMGTAVVTSVGMFGRFPGWPLPKGVHTLELAVGGAYERPAAVDGEVVIRKFLRVTLLLDHDLVDGAPAARAVDRLTELIEAAWGVDDDEWVDVDAESP